MLYDGVQSTLVFAISIEDGDADKEMGVSLGDLLLIGTALSLFDGHTIDFGA